MSVQTPHRTTVTVIGMTCEHCTRAVTEEIRAVNGVVEVEITLSSGNVTVKSDRTLDRAQIAYAVAEAGYSLAD